ncbi:aminoglycoside phosphotransferase family protein [Desulfovibrio inopinatus]|uniref:aminoglycoside phosphotransferase family protein n=1 Tax=Desulfovibrio inopinatus TaxID=102109 RepID=UPI000411A602|nr:aminoglycoside phosphotransferase family protein [Desulfovibrio inopinatus]
MNITTAILRYLQCTHRASRIDDPVFLAAGEYNANYLVHLDGRDIVFRINHGSQLGLSNQIEYEFHVLEAVAPSGVTPQPYWYDVAPEKQFGLDKGCLAMEYIPGRALQYERDLTRAADIFARIHALPTVQAAPHLIHQHHPIADIARESLGLIQRFPDHPRDAERSKLLDYHDTIIKLADETSHIFKADTDVIVNTEVNSGNFLISPERACLVDWEKAVISSRYQDLGHFCVPTTTLWKTDHKLSAKEKETFLCAYRSGLLEHEAQNVPELDVLREGTALLERTILLRALSWCFMAWYEYTQVERSLKNEETFRKITSYLDNMEWFFA